MSDSPSNSSVTPEYVILLHGLARTHRALWILSKTLETAGYVTINYNYPSTLYNIEQLAQDSIPNALKQVPAEAKVHFVTHSLGGILVRQYLRDHTIENLGRVVMLGPPNQGSEVADTLRELPGFSVLNGVAGGQLGTDEESVPLQLGPANFEVGIIAGTRTVNPILSTMLPDPDDGKVSVENTKLEGMTDHIVLPVTHTFMMNNPEVIKQVNYFLKYGGFYRQTT